MRFRIPYMEFTVFLITLTIISLLGEIAIRIYLLRHTMYDVEMARYSILLKKDSGNPKIGHMHYPARRAELMNVAVQINSDGFRDKEYTIDKKDKYRIIFLGDSLTFGWGVEEESSFANIIEYKLNEKYPAEVINFGTGNYNTEQEVNIFLEKGLKYKPDKVVVFYFINDAEETPKKSRFWFLGYSRIITFYWSRLNAFINNLFPQKRFYAYYRDLYRDDRKGWRNTKEAFLELRDVCIENNIKLQVILLPELHNSNIYLFKNEYGKVMEFLRSSNIDYHDLSPKFLNYSNPTELWVALDDAHPNKLAHSLIADYAFDFVLEKGGDN